mgnify:CR=1 FL=1
MVIGTGVDIIKISRIENIIKNKRDKFYNKIFTSNEIEYIKIKNHNAQTISGLFAAKEAISKVLGTGIGKVNWKDIEIIHDKLGKPYVKLYREGKNIAKKLDIDKINLSISHEKDYALAFAIGEGVLAKFHMPKVSKEISHILPKRKKDLHKGDFGRVGIIAGSKGMIGAAYLSSIAALRSGSGLVYNIVPKSLYEIFSIKLIESIIIPVEDNNTGHFILNSLNEVEETIQNKDVLAIGPGIGVDDERIEFIQNILINYNGPIVLDADGINCLAQDPTILLKRKGPTIITPHPGEMSRLLNINIQKIQENRVKYSKNISNKYNIITVLKGANTVVTNGKDIYINPTGNPGMATAGSGDVLTGIIASFIGQGIVPYKAAILGVYLHGLAGDLAKADKGEYGLIARDILENIPYALRHTLP